MDNNLTQGLNSSLIVDVSRLHPDKNNPRLPSDKKGKGEDEILLTLKKHFSLEELAYSISENGYFKEEPLVGIPDNIPEKFLNINDKELPDNEEYIEFLKNENTQFTIIEGNRRLSTVKILLSSDLREKFKVTNWPELDTTIESNISKLPLFVYRNRKDVLPYLGVRHITGIKKWDAYAKATYIADMVNQEYTIDDIQKQVGDRSNSARKIYFCYRLIETVENEFDIDTNKAKNLFSYLILAIGQGGVKHYLSLPQKLKDYNLETPVSVDKLENLKNLFSWMFGEGKEKFPVINESRDITNKLSHVLRNEDAIEHLKVTRDLDDAYERSDGERTLLMKNLKAANLKLQKSLGIIAQYKDQDVINEISKCQTNLDALQKLLKD